MSSADWVPGPQRIDSLLLRSGEFSEPIDREAMALFISAYLAFENERSDELPAPAKLVLIAMAHLSRHLEPSWVSPDQLASLLGMFSVQVSSSIDSLERVGFIRVSEVREAEMLVEFRA